MVWHNLKLLFMLWLLATLLVCFRNNECSGRSLSEKKIIQITVNEMVLSTAVLAIRACKPSKHFPIPPPLGQGVGHATK